MDDTRVHDALERLAADAPPSSDAVWQRTQQRIARRRRTRVLVTGALVVALLGGAVGVIAAVRSNDDGNRVAANGNERPTAPRTTARATSVTVPNVVGFEVSGAHERLAGTGLLTSTTGPGRLVYAQNPAAGATAERGSTVVLDTCPPTGLCVPPMPRASAVIAVPDFRGMTVTAADAERARLGFDGGVTIEKYHGTSRDHTKVFWQDPPPGTLRRAQDDVRMWACPNTERCVSPPQDFIDFGPNAVAWRSLPMSDPQWSAFAPRKFGTPDALARAVVDMFDRAPESPGRVTYIVPNKNAASAAVWVQIRNAPDDSVEGADYALGLVRRNGQWSLHDGRSRAICLRGKDSDNNCL
jgi:PASTA domain